MLTEHKFSQTKNTPSYGTVSAEIEGESAFSTDQLNFAYDFYTPDKKLRLTLNAVQHVEDEQGETVLTGIELVFNSELVSGTYTIKDGKFSATYWRLQNRDNVTFFKAFNADEGSVTLSINHQDEIYKGSFSFTSKGSGSTSAVIKSGDFSIKGRDGFTL